MILVTYSEKELQSLAGLLDLAVRQGGLRVSGEAYNHAQKLEAALLMWKSQDPNKGEFQDRKEDNEVVDLYKNDKE